MKTHTSATWGTVSQHQAIYRFPADLARRTLLIQGMATDFLARIERYAKAYSSITQ
jgi:hypothetical protein